MTTIVEGLRLTLYVGAACADATDEQRVLINGALENPLSYYEETGDETPIRFLIQQVMGDDWKPTAQWAAYIEALND